MLKFVAIGIFAAFNVVLAYACCKVSGECLRIEELYGQESEGER